MDTIVIYSLNGCGYSREAVKNLDSNDIKYKIYNIEWDNKEEYKIRNNMNTFPQIFYQDKYGKKIKIGGSDVLTELLDLIENTKKNKNIDKMINEIKQKLKLDRKTTLKVINLLK